MLGRIVLALLIAAAPTLACAQTRGSLRLDALAVDGAATLGSVVTPSLVLGGFALTGVGTTAGTLAAGNDTRIVGATQNAAAAITNGTIDGTAIGGTTRSSGAFTALTLTTPLSLVSGGCGASTASGCRTNIGLGSIATQGANAVAITGGTIDGTAIGGSVPALGAFTALTVSTPIPAASGGTGYASVTAALDALLGSTQGTVAYRGSAAWVGLAPGVSGQVLTTAGAGANPSWTTPATAAATPPVRQTAYTGPRNADASASFLPATTTGTLTLTAQNVSSTVPLGVTAAQGASNSSTSLTTNPSWTLTASTTNYLFINAATGATFVSTLLPIEQNGGTISTANNQFSFDYGSMTGYLGNGTAAVATPLVPVGEAVTSTTAVTSTAAYAYNGIYVGAVATLANGTQYTATTNLGTRAIMVTWWIENVTAEQGYAVGDRIYDNAAQYTSGGTFFQNLLRTGGRNSAVFYTGANGLGGTTASGGASSFTTANWRAGYIIKRAYGGS